MVDWQKIPHYFWYFTVLYLINLSTLAKNPTIMQKHLFTLMAAILLSASFLTGCKEDPPPPAKTKSELITQGSWKFSSATVGGSDVSAFIQACQKDNILVFVAAGTGTLDEGPLKCNAGDPQTTPFTWNFQTNETQLFISTPLFTGGSSTFTLVSISETQLVVSQNITVSGSTQNAVVTFVH